MNTEDNDIIKKDEVCLKHIDGGFEVYDAIHEGLICELNFHTNNIEFVSSQIVSPRGWGEYKSFTINLCVKILFKVDGEFVTTYIRFERNRDNNQDIVSSKHIEIKSEYTYEFGDQKGRKEYIVYCDGSHVHVHKFVFDHNTEQYINEEVDVRNLSEVETSDIFPIVRIAGNTPISPITTSNSNHLGGNFFFMTDDKRIFAIDDIQADNEVIVQEVSDPKNIIYDIKYHTIYFKAEYHFLNTQRPSDHIDGIVDNTGYVVMPPDYIYLPAFYFDRQKHWVEQIDADNGKMTDVFQNMFHDVRIEFNMANGDGEIKFTQHNRDSLRIHNLRGISEWNYYIKSHNEAIENNSKYIDDKY